MTELLLVLHTATRVVRVVALAIVVLFAVLAVIDWAVSTRRVSPFGALGRLSRRWIDPMLKPVEQRLLRAGLRPHNAGWWAALIAVVVGLLLITFVDFLVALVAQAMYVSRSGPGAGARLLLVWAIGLLQFAIFFRVITSWINVSPYARWVRWSYVLTEWFLGPLRRALPTVGPMDISPIVAYFALWLLKSAIL